jgi:hypothetical protein
MLTIQIQIRSVYGKEIAYPMNDEAHCVARIANTKTLTRYALMQVLGMGATIVELDRHGGESRRYVGARQANSLPMVA